MAKLSDIIAEMNDDVKVQFLHESVVKVADKKRTADTAITFATGEVNCNSFYDSKKVGIVVWVDRDEYNKAITKLNN